MTLCGNCRETKPDSDFEKTARYSSGLSRWCKVCITEQKERYKNRNQPVFQTEGRAETPAAIRATIKDLEFLRSSADWKRGIKTRYNMDSPEYERILLSQNYSCAICGKHLSEGGRNFCIDHDHVTGKNRGLLCTNCNVALGLLKDDPQIISKALEYLNHHTGKYE